MNNADMPAMPQSGTEGATGDLCSSEDWGGKGLTKREQFCIAMGVSETGDQELDAIIRKGNEQKFASLAMQGLLAADGRDGAFYKSMDDVAKPAIQAAQALLQQLEGGKDE